MSFRAKIALTTFAFLISTNSFAITNNNIDDLAHDFMRTNRVPGLAIAVIENNHTKIYTYGYANIEKRTAIKPETIYTIASFSKTFTGTLGAIASVENKLDLDTPFTTYLTDVKNEHLSQITTRELLAHTSSFPFDFLPRPKTYEQAIDALNQFEPTTPGSVYSYSNAGIGTAGFTIAAAYHDDYEALLTTKLLYPLNMKSTYLHVPDSKLNLVATGYDKDGHPVIYNNDIETWYPAASLKSTIVDMSKYLKAHIDPHTTHQAKLTRALELTHQNYYCFTDGISCEQLAWQAHDISTLDSAIGDTYFEKFDSSGFPIFATKTVTSADTLKDKTIFIDKTGSGYGMSSYMAYIPDKKIGVVIMLNKFMGDERIKLGRDILKHLSQSH